LLLNKKSRLLIRRSKRFKRIKTLLSLIYGNTFIGIIPNLVPKLLPNLALKILLRLKPKDNNNTTIIYIVSISGYNYLIKKVK